MKELIETLRALQGRLLSPEPVDRKPDTEIARLRGQLPPTVEAHFDRFIQRGRKGIAAVSHGVCGECHLQLSTGTLAGLLRMEDMHRCDNCGRYLYPVADVPSNEASAARAFAAVARPEIKPTRRRRSARTA